MIYLIGGPPKCGKTTLAKKMSRELQIPWISTDTLQNIVWAYSAKEKRPELFPHSYLRGDSNDEFYSENSIEQIVKDYIAQGETCYEAISMMAQTYLTDEDDFIVEGYSVTPEIIAKIFNKFGKEHIRAVFLVKHNEQQFIKDVHKSNTPNDWILRKTKEEVTFTKIAQMVSVYSRYFEEEAIKHSMVVLTMDNDFEKQLSEAQRYLTK